MKELRRRKHRDEKPLAVMVSDLDMARSYATLSEAEVELLRSPARPIVLVTLRPGLAPSVAPGFTQVGLFLPYTPLHELLLARVGRPLVMTSGNRSDEPMAVDNDEAVTRLAGIADGFLVHDRPIATRTDDSVARVIEGAPMVLRRARGYAPAPIPLPAAIAGNWLCVGAQMKNVVGVAAGDRIVRAAGDRIARAAGDRIARAGGDRIARAGGDRIAQILA